MTRNLVLTSTTATSYSIPIHKPRIIAQDSGFAGCFENRSFSVVDKPPLRSLTHDGLASILYPSLCETRGHLPRIQYESEIKLSLFILATWIADRLPSVPYLLVQGPFGSGKTPLLKLLSCLCRRSILLSGLTPSEFFSLPLALRPTLLLDETIINPEMSLLLRGTHPRHPRSSQGTGSGFRRRPQVRKVTNVLKLPGHSSYLSRAIYGGKHDVYLCTQDSSKSDCCW
jgi:hypothetical protein